MRLEIDQNANEPFELKRFLIEGHKAGDVVIEKFCF